MFPLWPLNNQPETSQKLWFHGDPMGFHGDWMEHLRKYHLLGQARGEFLWQPELWLNTSICVLISKHMILIFEPILLKVDNSWWCSKFQEKSRVSTGAEPFWPQRKRYSFGKSPWTTHRDARVDSCGVSHHVKKIAKSSQIHQKLGQCPLPKSEPEGISFVHVFSLDKYHPNVPILGILGVLADVDSEVEILTYVNHMMVSYYVNHMMEKF